MRDLTWFILKAFVRKALAILGTFLLTHGILSNEEADGLISLYLEEVVGGLLIAGSGAWTLAYQWYVRRKVVAALSLPPGANSAQLERATAEQD